MNRIQGKLMKLAEEAAEVAQECSKAAFYPNHEHEGRTAEERLREEIIDVLIVARVLQSLKVIRPIYEDDVRNQFAAKEAKIDRWTNLSHQLGGLSSPWAPTEDDISRDNSIV